MCIRDSDLAAPDDHRVRTLQLDVVGAEQRHDPERRSRDVPLAPEPETADVDGAEAIDVLDRVDRLHYPRLANLRRDRRLDDETVCLLYTSPSPRDRTRSRMPSSA